MCRAFPALAGARPSGTVTVPNLLVDQVLRVRLTNGRTAAESLPGVLGLLVRDQVEAFLGLRPHQRHAWHAFLVQLAVLALNRAGNENPPEDADAWRSLLRGLTSTYSNDEPWCLVVDNAASPAFMQCPSPGGLGDYKKAVETPDDLDVLVTSKNHDVKQSIAVVAEPEDWAYALVSLQTMAGFLGAGNYGVARMNGGFSTRPCLGLAPAEGGLGAHFVHDVRRMLARRDALLEEYPQYFKDRGGLALLWTEPWSGAESYSLNKLDPYFIEICRRVRLVPEGQALVAKKASSRKPRIGAKEAKGNVGDHWTPVEVADGKALSVSSAGFRYDQLFKLLFGEGFRRPPAMDVRGSPPGQWRLVARSMAGGQGKTEGYYERNDIRISSATARPLFGGARRKDLADLAKEQMDEIKEVARALRFGVAVAASGGKNGRDLSKADRAYAGPYLRRLDGLADSLFFSALERRFSAGGEEKRMAERTRFARTLIDAGGQLLDEASGDVPCTAIRRHRARARASSAYWGRLRGGNSVFADQPEIFSRAREVPHAE